MSTRGMPLLSRPPPESGENESACRKCNKEFNIIFTRARRCNHCGYSFCHSCTDYQALMPRHAESVQAEAGGSTNANGYDPMPVCAYCIEMLQITATDLGQLKQLRMEKLKKYAKAYSINVAGIIEKNEFVERLVAARGANGCLLPKHEAFYREHSIPQSGRPRGIFARAMDAMAGDRASSSSSASSQAPPPRTNPHPQYPQYHSPRQRTTSGPSTYVPNRPQQAPPRPGPPPHFPSQPPHAPSGYAPPPGHPPWTSNTPFAGAFTAAQNSNHLHVPPPSPRPRAASASSPSTPPPAPEMDALLEMPDAQLGALSVGVLKEILFKNHVTARLVVEKSELVARVRELVEQERRERERKADEEAAERAFAEALWADPSSSSPSAPRSVSPQPPPADDERDPEARVDSGDAPVSGTSSSEPIAVPQSKAGTASPASSPTKGVGSAASASRLSAMARLERTGLCVICQDDEANIAIVDCGHLAMCTGCSKLIMESTRECPLCRTRIITDNRLLRIFRS